MNYNKITILNFVIGLTNLNYNMKSHKSQKIINDKLDYIIRKLNNDNGNNERKNKKNNN